MTFIAGSVRRAMDALPVGLPRHILQPACQVFISARRRVESAYEQKLGINAGLPASRKQSDTAGQE